MVLWVIVILILVIAAALVVRVVRSGWEAMQIFGRDAPDAGDDWLAKQIREEQRSRAFLEREGLKVRAEHFENCDARELRMAHEEYCDAEKARSDVRGQLPRRLERTGTARSSSHRKK